MEERTDTADWKILLVDDEVQALRMYGSLLAEEGYTVINASDGRGARKALEREERLGLVILDLRLPDVEELELFRWIRKRAPALPVIILTGYGSVDSAVHALKEGAYHYLTKPPETELWRSLIRSALQQRALEDENYRLRQELRSSPGEGGLIGRSRTMLEVCQWIRVVGPTQSAVLVGGESGTGKELAARALHLESGRREGPFISMNCGALPPHLLESELFGYERGAFTGAVTSRPGLFERADGGTIFLDEIAECAPALQVRLLRVLQEKEVRRIGSGRLKKSDFRLIAATNRSLEDEVRDGRFRRDLYYRINVIGFDMPALRERRDDIPLLTAFFMERYRRREGKRVDGISDDAMDLLMRYSWPGNVRELENAIERAVVVCRGRELNSEDLPPQLEADAGRIPRGTDLLAGERSLADIEKHVISATLERHRGNKSQAARVLGISRKLLYTKIRAYGL